MNHTLGGITSPNPNYPKEIINVEGKNKLKLPNGTYSNNGITAEVTDGELTLNGTANGNAIIYIPFAYSFKTKAYTLSFNNPVASTAVILRFDSNIMPETAGIINRTYSYTFSEITTVTNFVVRVSSGNTVTNFKLKPMLEEGSIASPYVPYNCIQIKKCNKNLCKLDVPNLLMNSNNVIVSSNYPTTIINTTNITSLCVSGDFSLLDYNVIRACGTNEYPALGVTGTKLTNIGTNNNIIDTTDYNYIMLTWIVSGAISEELKQAIESSFQVEEGTVQTTYIKHEEQTYNFPLSEGQKLYEGSYLAEDGIHYVRGQVVLDGTEIGINTDGATTNYRRFTIPKAVFNNISNTAISDYFKYIANYNLDEPHFYIGSTVYFFALNSTATVTDFRNWLSTHNITVEYELATEQIIPYTPEQQAVIDEIINDGTYKEVTHYEAEANINPDMEVTYYKDLETLINNIESRLSLLE